MENYDTNEKMERYFMFLGKKNQYCENDYTTKCNLQIQYDPYQIITGIFRRTRTKNFTIHMETQKILNSQSSPEKEEWSWKNQYCEKDYTTKCNLQIQCNPYQITNGIFYRTRTKNFRIHTETQKTPNSQSSLEQEE